MFTSIIMSLALYQSTTNSCHIVGDSIADGIHQRRPECRHTTRPGWSSDQWMRSFGRQYFTASTVIISLGSNDGVRSATLSNLTRLRRNISANRVIWIMPQGVNRSAGISVSVVQQHVEAVARINNDPIVRFRPSDGVHPSPYGYTILARRTRG